MASYEKIEGRGRQDTYFMYTYRRANDVVLGRGLGWERVIRERRTAETAKLKKT